MADAASKVQGITLDVARTPDAKVLVDDGGGLIVMGIGDAVASCIAGNRALGSARNELNNIIDYLKDWHAKRVEKIAALHVTISQGEVFILCAPKSNEYDFDLGDELAKLNIGLTESYQLFGFDSVQCPMEGFTGFANFKGIPPANAD